MKITEEQLAELERLAAAATSGTWKAELGNVGTMCKPRHGRITPTFAAHIVGIAPANAEYVAAAANAVPTLVAEVRALREVLRGAAFAMTEAPCRCSGGFRCTPCKSRDEIRAALGEG